MDYASFRLQLQTLFDSKQKCRQMDNSTKLFADYPPVYVW